MALFNNEDYGKVINEKLSKMLRNYSDKYDRATVSIETGVGTSTVRDVVFRTNALTESNSKAIIELVQIAIKNCEQGMVNAEEAKEFFLSKTA